MDWMDGRDAARAAFVCTTGVSALVTASAIWTAAAALGPHLAALRALLAA